GFLVIVLAVDDRREAVARIGLHALPHVQHRSAGRVHERAADRAQPLEVPDRDPERGKHDDVVGPDGGEVEVAALGTTQDGDAHRLELRVDVGIMDDLAHEKDAPVGKLRPGLVGVLDRAIHTVAEAELAGELDREVADLQGVAPGADPIHQAAVVIRRQGAFDAPLQPEPAPEVRPLHAVNLTVPGSARPPPAARQSAAGPAAARHGCGRQGTVSARSSTPRNSASTLTRPAPPASRPDPRAATVRPSGCGVTVTVPLSKATPCAPPAA